MEYQLVEINIITQLELITDTSIIFKTAILNPSL